MKYISTKDTAKIIRKALKESFPGVKFSVRSSVYSGGSSIDVAWTDGPCNALVEGITDLFNGSYFDGMTDYKGSKTHIYNGERIHWGPDFVFVIERFLTLLSRKLLILFTSGTKITLIPMASKSPRLRNTEKENTTRLIFFE